MFQLIFFFSIIIVGFIFCIYYIGSLFSKKSNNLVFKIIGGITVIIYGMIVYGLIAMPPFITCVRYDNRYIRCIKTNVLLIQNAVEMYNMDNDTMMTTLDLKTLVNKHYLRDIPKGPEPDCEYYSTGDLSGDGYIACKRHGTIPNM